MYIESLLSLAFGMVFIFVGIIKKTIQSIL